jgi:hypothetical protein
MYNNVRDKLLNIVIVIYTYKYIFDGVENRKQF